MNELASRIQHTLIETTANEKVMVRHALEAGGRDDGRGQGG